MGEPLALTTPHALKLDSTKVVRAAILESWCNGDWLRTVQIMLNLQ